MTVAPAGATSPRAAFTLLELLAVLAITAVLAALAISAGQYAAQSAKVARTRGELALVAAALEDYRRVFGDYPRTGDNARMLQSLLGKFGPDGTAIAGRAVFDASRFATVGARDPRTDPGAELADAWGQPYRFFYRSQTPWTNVGYVLYSVGPDGIDVTVLNSGGFPDFTASPNADNLFAHGQ